MHVPDGFLDPATSAATAAVAAAGVAVALRGARELDERTAPMAGLTAAFVFAVQMMNFPVAAGTSGHLIGAAFTAVLVGPWTAVLCMTVVLLVQAVVFADGGLTALGTNSAPAPVDTPGRVSTGQDRGGRGARLRRAGGRLRRRDQPGAPVGAAPQARRRAGLRAGGRGHARARRLGARGVPELAVGGGLPAKATLSVLAATLLAATTEPRALLRGLERLRLPQVLVQILMFMIRYVDVVGGELRRMRVARESRGFQARHLGALRVLGTAAGSLLLRSYERGERVHLAMLSRGYSGRLPTGPVAAVGERPRAMALSLPLAAAGVLLAGALAG